MGFPFGALVREETWSVVDQVRTGGPSIGGQQQLVMRPGVLWKLDVEIILPNQAVPAWNAWIRLQRGGMRPVLLGPREPHSPSTTAFATLTGFSGGERFSGGEGFRYRLDPFGPGTLSGAAAHRATRVSVALSGGADGFSAGQYIGFASRLYQIDNVTAGDPADDVAILDIWPPLRSALPDATPVDAAPVTKMIPTDPDAGSAPNRSIGGTVRMNLSWFEDLSSAEVLPS